MHQYLLNFIGREQGLVQHGVVIMVAVRIFIPEFS